MKDDRIRTGEEIVSAFIRRWLDEKDIVDAEVVAVCPGDVERFDCMGTHIEVFFEGGKSVLLVEEGATLFDLFVDILEDKLNKELRNGGDVSLCGGCHCMTHTVEGKCGKCNAEKGD